MYMAPRCATVSFATLSYDDPATFEAFAVEARLDGPGACRLPSARGIPQNNPMNELEQKKHIMCTLEI